MKLSDKIEKIEKLIDAKNTKQLTNQSLKLRLEDGNDKYIKILRNNFPKFSLKAQRLF